MGLIVLQSLFPGNSRYNRVLGCGTSLVAQLKWGLGWSFTRPPSPVPPCSLQTPNHHIQWDMVSPAQGTWLKEGVSLKSSSGFAHQPRALVQGCAQRQVHLFLVLQKVLSNQQALLLQSWLSEKLPFLDSHKAPARGSGSRTYRLRERSSQGRLANVPQHTHRLPARLLCSKVHRGGAVCTQVEEGTAENQTRGKTFARKRKQAEKSNSKETDFLKRTPGCHQRRENIACVNQEQEGIKKKQQTRKRFLH